MPRVFSSLLQGSFQGLLQICLVHIAPLEATLHIIALLLVVDELAELPQLVLQVLAFVLLVIVGDVLTL